MFQGTIANQKYMFTVIRCMKIALSSKAENRSETIRTDAQEFLFCFFRGDRLVLLQYETKKKPINEKCRKCKDYLSSSHIHICNLKTVLSLLAAQNDLLEIIPTGIQLFRNQCWPITILISHFEHTQFTSERQDVCLTRIYIEYVST